MDKIDQKLLKELDLNPRIPLTKLAKHLRISQQKTDYRIKRLFQNNYLTKLGTIINLKALGREHYRLFITFNSNHKYSNKDIFNYLKDKEGVYWIARTGGKYDLHITLFVFDFNEHDKFLEDFNNQFPNLIKDIKSCYGLEHNIFRHKYFDNPPNTLLYNCNNKPIKIDKLDFNILNKIKDNCRLSALELSKGTNFSYKTIINRIKSLEKNKVLLGYRAFMSFQEHSKKEMKPFIILLSFRNYSQSKEKALFSYLAVHKSVTQTIRLFGIWNALVLIRTENLEQLQNIIIELRNKFDIIDDYEVISIFEDIGINLLPITNERTLSQRI